MSEESDKPADKPPAPKYEKGDRAAIVAGRKNPIGTRGSVFWIGENKYGPGFRYGFRGDDGETYWVDETHLGSEDDAPPPPDAPPPKPELEKGTYVVITGGREGVGEKGEVFWSGPNKYGPGFRYGVRGEGDASFWVDGQHVEVTEGSAPPRQEKPSGGAGPRMDDAPLPDSNEFADEAPIYDGGPASAAPPPDPGFDDAPFPDDGAPAEGGGGFEDDAPFPDDVPF
ncbi:MAG: hypothetical protein AB8I08_19220 [Sandaracinaceae bacterium]